MKNKILFTAGVIFGILSVYPILGWIYIFNVYSEASHIEKQSLFFQKFLFGINPEDSVPVHFLIIFFGIVSVFIFSILIHSLNKRVNKKGHFILYLSLLIIFSIFTFLNIWSIL